MDREAVEIRRFLANTDSPRVVLADGQAGLFDEHGRLRAEGAIAKLISAGTSSGAIVRNSRSASRPSALSFDASPAAYANADAGGGTEQTAGWFLY